MVYNLIGFVLFYSTIAVSGIPVVSDEEFRLDYDGSCRSPSGPILIRDLWLLRNSSISFSEGEKAASATIKGEDVHLEIPEEGATTIYQIDRFIDETSDLDIELAFALLNGRPMLFWKETFRHKKYRLGLIELTDHGPVVFCHGEGGRSITH